LLPQVKPRYYSISSSPKVSPNRASITVSVVKGTSPTGRLHLGSCSNFLRDMPMKEPEVLLKPGLREAEDFTLTAVLKDTGSTFRLPNKEKPIIMVGPGTGLAPMRGFIQDRVADRARQNLLFFGCRSEKSFLYRSELEKWVADGFLTMHVAFSRQPDTPKTYVQHLIEKQAPQVKDMLEKGASIYVCGDASRMAPDVRAAFARIAGEDSINEMEAAGRYCQDVWAAQSL